MAGAGEGIEAFFVRRYPAARHLAFLLVGDLALAEEVAMDAFVAASSGWRRIGSLDHPEAYVRQMVVNLATSRLRRRGAERRANARVGAGEPVELPWDPAVGERAREVAEAVRRLPARQRACVALFYFEDLSVVETAVALRCSVGTVKSQLAKARTSLGYVLGHLAEKEGQCP